MIKPTVGRVVWYHPATFNGLAGDSVQPLAAIVARVWTDASVNLAVFDSNGVSHSRTSVLLVQEDDPVPDGAYCEWMPYQKGQAAKTESLDAKPIDSDIEKEILAKGLTAPRITPADIEANIAGEYYFTGDSATCDCPQLPSLALLTFCVLVLKNGFTVTGESACASPENFDAELGRKIARQNAVSKVWPLMGYALKEKLSTGLGIAGSMS